MSERFQYQAQSLQSVYKNLDKFTYKDYLEVQNMKKGDFEKALKWVKDNVSSSTGDKKIEWEKFRDDLIALQT